MCRRMRTTTPRNDPDRRPWRPLVEAHTGSRSRRDATRTPARASAPPASPTARVGTRPDPTTRSGAVAPRADRRTRSIPLGPERSHGRVNGSPDGQTNRSPSPAAWGRPRRTCGTRRTSRTNLPGRPTNPSGSALASPDPGAPATFRDSPARTRRDRTSIPAPSPTRCASSPDEGTARQMRPSSTDPLLPARPVEGRSTQGSAHRTHPHQ